MKNAFLEIGKTVVWWPWAIIELLRGHLGPDMKGLLLVSVFGQVILVGFLALLTFGSVSMEPAYPWFRFFVIVTTFVYMTHGALVRIFARRFGLLA